jgi:hypothetical protein
MIEFVPCAGCGDPVVSPANVCVSCLAEIPPAFDEDDDGD